jgi:DNA-binding CsgD family transcriptional regulator
MAAATGAEALVERELETAHLRRALDHSWHGVGRVVLIQGPGGIGKTTLLAAARRLARDAGMNVRTARGAELEQSFSFGVVRQLFDSLLAAAGEAERGEWLAGAAALAAPLFAGKAPLHEPRGDESIYPLLHGLYWLCANVARESPLALLVDDVHWADEPSLSFLGFLARRLEELPILLVMAARPLDPESVLGVGLLADPDTRVLSLRELSADGVERMLAARVGDGVEQRFARACHEATAGNPFLLRELVLELEQRGIAPHAPNAALVGTLVPARITEAVRGRLGRLAPAARQFAQAVAILGDGVGLAPVAALAGQDEETAVDAAGALRANDLIDDDPGLAFAHPIIRAAVYQSVLPAERVRRHAQAARLLHERMAPPEQIAAQILLADGLSEPWIRDQLHFAANAALGLGAPRQAVAYLTRALERPQGEDDRGRLLAQLGNSEVLAGLPEGPVHLEEAVSLTSDYADHAKVAVDLARVLKFTGGARRSVELLSEIGEISDSEVNDAIQIELLSNALISHTARQLLTDRIRTITDHRRAAGTVRERFELVLLAFEKMLENRPTDEMINLLARAGADGGLLDEGAVMPPGVVSSGAVLIYCDRLDAATTISTELIERSRKYGSLTALVVGLSLRAEIAYRRGDLAQALADATAAFERSGDMAAIRPVLATHPVGVINNVAVEQDRSEPELEELIARTDHYLNPDSRYASGTFLSRARLLLARGQDEAALEQLLELGALDHTFGAQTPAFLPWRSDAAMIMHRLGDQPGAARLAAEEVELARQMGARRAIGIALRAYGLVQPEPAVEVLTRAVGVLERSPARLEHARALIDLGAAMRRSGERASSRAPLREGYDLAARWGATKLAARARAEIGASGARVSARGLSGAESLTPSERRVAELAADGQTNRDIAQTLFITEKTVETHLGHVYDKLDVRTRHKLRAALG